MKKSSVSAARAAGLLAGLFGAIMAGHWVVRADTVTRLIPGAELLGIANPLLFVAAGIGLFSASLSRPAAWHAHVKALCIAGLVALPAGYLFEGITGIALGIDFVRAGAAPTAANPHPGRMSPNASLAFLLIGIALWLHGRRPTRAGRRMFLAATLAVCSVGLAGLVGYFVGLEMLYKVASFNRMLPVTAFGLSVIGAGLWMLHEATGAFDPAAVHESEQRIRRRSVVVLTLVTLAGGVAGFAVMRDTFERSVSQDMLLNATTNAASLAHTIDVAAWLAKTVAGRPGAREALHTLSKTPQDGAARAFLQKAADSVLSDDLIGIEIHAADGERVAQAGTPASAKAQVIQRLANVGPVTTLAWNDGYLLLAETPVLVGGRTVGRVRTAQRLRLFDELVAHLRAASDTSDVAICGRDRDKAICAPNRFRPEGFETPMFDAAHHSALPVTRALLGERGVEFLKDRRGNKVLSAFAPIKDTGLALAVRTDLDTLYAPLRSQLNILVLVLGGIVVLAIYAQHSQVRPVLKQLVASQQMVKAIVDDQSELVSLVKPDGELGYVNPAYARHFGLKPAEMIGRNMFDFVEPAEHETVRQAVAQVLSTGKTTTGESRITTADGAVRWIAWTDSLQHDRAGAPMLHSVGRDVTERRLAEQAVRDSEHRLRMITDNLPVLISYLDRDLRFRFANRTYQQWFGADAPQIGSSVQALHDAQTWAEIEPRLRAALAGEPVSYSREIKRPEGSRHVQVNVVPDRDERGSVVGLYALIGDVTPHREAQRALLESESRLRTVADSLPMRVAYVDADERYCFNNLAYERALGRPREQLHGQTVRAVLGDAAYQAVEPHVRSALRGEAVTFQSEMASGGSYVCYEAHYIPQVAADGGTVLGFHAVITDITRQKLEERRLVELSRVDPLTGVVNRTGFELRVADAMQRSRTTGGLMALMYLDIDRFKQINDRFGHDVGDALLRGFAGRLSQTLRSTDTVARLGGDEFTVIMEGLPRPEIASTVGNKIVQAMSAPFLIEQQTIHVTTSIGLAFYQGDATTADALVKQADTMLYRAKSAGRNNVQTALRLIEGGRA